MKKAKILGKRGNFFYKKYDHEKKGRGKTCFNQHAKKIMIVIQKLNDSAFEW